MIKILKKLLHELFVYDIIKEELNVKSVEFKLSLGEFVSYVFKPQLKTVGPKYGKQLNEIRVALDTIDSASAKAELDSNGSIKLSLPSGEVELLEEDLLISTTQKEGLFTLSDRGVTVALDTVLTEELIEEGQFCRALLHYIAEDILDHFLSGTHIIGQIGKSHLRLYHPELSKVAWSV